MGAEADDFGPRALAAAAATAGALGAAWVVVVAHQAIAVLLVGVLLGVLVEVVGRGLAALLPISRRWAARLVLGGATCAAVVVAARYGPAWVASLEALVRDAPTLYRSATAALGETSWGRSFAALAPPPEALVAELRGSELLGRASVGLVGGLVGLVVALIFGVWVGVAPQRTLGSIVALLPESSRPRARQVFDACHAALRMWVLGRLVDMSLLATLTAISLSVLGLPHALPLGLMSGAMELVPYVGPMLAVGPIALTTLAVAPHLLLPVLALLAAIQTFQSYVVTPLVEQQAVSVPPAAGIAAQVVATYLLGPLGLLLATPLVVVATVSIQSLWIEDHLHEGVHVLGT